MRKDAPPFSSIQSVVACVAFYFISIKASQMYMKNQRDPFSLKWLSVFHNLFLFLLSVAMFVGMAVEVFKVWNTQGVFILFCDPEGVMGHGLLAFWYYIFYVSKIYEFLDTYIQIFKHKQPPFLHTWHHCTTLTIVWATLTTEISIQWLSISANAFVHIFMYCYYFLASLEMSVWWKRYLTKLQIIQFVVTIGINLYWLYGYHHHQCSGNVWAWSYGMFIVTTFLFLFIRFYQDSYKRGKKAAAGETSTIVASSNGGDSKSSSHHSNGTTGKHHKDL